MFYFAYGSNMSVADMAARAPSARALGVGVLAGHRLFVTAEGYVAVRPEPHARVFGVVWRLAARDLVKLDRYEGGLYARRLAPVRLAGRMVRCLIYVAVASAGHGRPRRDYFLNAVKAPAVAWGLPAAYIDHLDHLARRGFRG